MDMTVSKRRYILLVGIADGVVVIEIRVSSDKNMVDSSTEKTRDFEVEEFSDLVREESEETVDEEDDNEDPFKNSVD